MVLFVANCIKFHLTAFNDIDVVVHGLLDPKVPLSPPFRQVGNRTEKRPSLGVFIQISFSKTKGPKRFYKFPNQFRFLGNCPPTPLLSQHQHLILTQGKMLD